MLQHPNVRLGVLLESIQDGLPSLALHLHRIFVFHVERLCNLRRASLIFKGDGDRAAVAHNIFDQRVRRDLGVGSGEIKSHTAILRLHPRRERAAFAQIIHRRRRVPIVGRGIPLFDVLRLRPALPYMVNGGVDESSDGDRRFVSHVAIILTEISHCDNINEILER